MAAMAMQEIDIRLIVRDDIDTAQLLRAIGRIRFGVNTGKAPDKRVVLEAVVLKNDGFSRLIPDPTTRQIFGG